MKSRENTYQQEKDDKDRKNLFYFQFFQYCKKSTLSWSNSRIMRYQRRRLMYQILNYQRRKR